MKIIGVTGGIGSGKSTVARLLEERGAAVIDADKIGHDVLGQPQVRRELVEAFGEGILGSGGEVDRARLGKVAFADPQALERLNRITHPRIRAVIDGLLEEYRWKGVEVVALEAAMMVESGATSMVDEVWVTVAPERAVLERIKKRSGLSGEETLARIRSQASDEERARYADVIIRNDGSLEELWGEVEKQWNRLVRGA